MGKTSDLAKFNKPKCPILTKVAGHFGKKLQMCLKLVQINLTFDKNQPLETLKLCEIKHNISPQFIYKMVDKKRRTMQKRLLDDI